MERGLLPPFVWKTDLIASCRILLEFSLFEFPGLQEADDTVILAGVFLHTPFLATFPSLVDKDAV